MRCGAVGVVLLVTTLGAPPPVDAQVTDADEGTVPGVEVTTEEAYYDLDQPTLSEVAARLNAMRLQGPDGPRSQGLTQYSIEPAWRMSAGGGRCRVSRVTIHVEVTITLPRWPRVDSRPEREQEQWAAVERSIREHEYHHRDLTLDAAEQLLDALTDLEATGCIRLGRVVEGEISIIDGRLRDAHAAFDRATPPRLRIG